MKDLFDFREDPFITSVMTLMIGVILFFIIDIGGAQVKHATGQVHEMSFKEGNQSTTVGMVYTGKSTGPVVATSGHPDEWSLIVRVGSEYMKIECGVNQFYNTNPGDQIKIRRVYGWISGTNYRNSIIP